MSFKELAQASGMSVSYLNEIEKGKKYPKTEKILSLSEALGVSYDELVSVKLSKKLNPIAELLNSGILDSLPLSLFGLETSTLLELMSGAPTKINAFISTILKVARYYEMSSENFYLAALRSYQEMHDNYFEDLELQVQEFASQFDLDILPPVKPAYLEEILIRHYGYSIDRNSLHQDYDLNHFRSLYFPKGRSLLLNANLSTVQQAFIIGKELAFNYLNIKQRPYNSNLFRVNSFEEVHNNFKASYFSVALLLNQHSLVQDLQKFFERPTWEPEAFMNLVKKYGASPEMFFHRLTNLLPKFFGIDNLFFLRFNERLNDPKRYHITKELHLARPHLPHASELLEYYCRRWVSIRILQAFKSPAAQQQEYLIDVQRSQYVDTQDEYFCLSLSRVSTPTLDAHVSITLGIHVNEASKQKIKFINDEKIPRYQVGETCERCPLHDCEQREAPASILNEEIRYKQIDQKLNVLRKKSEELTFQRS